MMMMMQQAQAAQAHAGQMGSLPMPAMTHQLNPMMMAQPVQPPTAQVKDPKWLKNNLAEFEKYSNDEKKNVLGNMMYNKVNELHPPADLIPKITGMLIDLEVLSIQEIIEILENSDLLAERMHEAIKIIEEDAEGN